MKRRILKLRAGSGCSSDRRTGKKYAGRKVSAAVAAAACFTIAATALTACGSGSDGASATTAGTATATGTAAAGEGSGDATDSDAGTVAFSSLPTYEIIADATGQDGTMSYTLPGGDSPAGTVVVDLKNNDTAMAHQAQLMRLHDGITPEQFTEAIDGPEGVGAVVSMADFAGGPNAIGPGAASEAVVHLDPDATYMVICQLPAQDGKPHYAHGMIGHFTTSGDVQVTGWPAADATVTMKDFQFSEPDGPDGVDWTKPIAVVNDGRQPHELVVLGAAPGKTIDDVRAALQKPEDEQSGPPPYETFGGVAAAAPGVTQQTTLKLASGDYLLACFVVDPQTGKPHYMMGMEQPITVK